MSAIGQRFDAVLFDLDGTLVDSAPDLAAAVNAMRVDRGLAPVPYARLRPLVGAGARGMLAGGFDLEPDAKNFEVLRTEFLDRYEAALTVETRVFDGLDAVLRVLETARLPWGIVTNKATRFAEPLVEALQLRARAGAVVAGDTTPHAKPHPAPLLEAARRLGVMPARCVYVGDDLRDVVAGRAAGMATVAVAWGYLGEAEPIDQWGADHVVETPLALLQLLGLP